MRNASRALGVVAIIAAAILWGMTGTIQALLPEGKQPLVVAAMRLLIGAAALVALALLTKGSRVSFRDLPVAGIVLAGLAIGLYNIVFFLAVIEAGVGIGTAIAIGSAPLWVTLYEFAARRQIPGALRIFAQAISIAGACLLVFSGGNNEGSPIGFILAPLAGAAYAAYSLITSTISQQAPSATIAASTFSVAAIAVSPVLFFTPLAWLADIKVWPALICLGICSTGISYAFYSWGLTRVAASTAVTLALAEPLTAWLLATFIVGEDVTIMKIAGAALLMAGLAIVSLTPAEPTMPAKRIESPLP